MPDDDELKNEPEVESIPEGSIDAEENIPGEMEIAPPKDGFNVVGPKDVILKLLQQQPLLIGIAVFALLFFIIIMFICVYDGSGGNNLSYKEGACKTVTVYYEPYNEEEASSTKTMDLETYVRSATSAYMEEIGDVGSGVLHVYYALSIALRTEAVTNDCKVTYRDKELSTEVAENTYLDIVMEAAKGVIITDSDENYITTNISDFCWNSQNEDMTYNLNNGLMVSDTFSNTYLINEVYTTCTCNLITSVIEDITEDSFESSYGDIPSVCFTRWVSYIDYDDEGNIEEIYYDYAYLHQDEYDSLSVGGALYLMQTFGYDYSLILKYFYGDDIKFMTVEEESTTTLPTYTCVAGEFPYTYTTLTKSEFVSLVTEYINGRENHADWAEYFITYAEEIYDMGLEKNINPELIYILVLKETGFRTNNTDTANYNYYGYGTYNGSSHGTLFSSFMEGIETMFDYLAKKDSLSALVQVYSYIGTYLVNPGSSGSGGCYYLTLDAIFGSDYSRCSSDYYCDNVSSGGGDCVETTQEEKDAYIEYQSTLYWTYRESIFKLAKTTTCSGTDISTDASTEIATNPLTESLDTFLESNGSSISVLNDTIMANVVSAGVGTRAGVAATATTLINFMMDNFDVRIPYTYGGGHKAIKGVGHNVYSYYGVDPEWGTPIGDYYDPVEGFGPYKNYGPDCSAFVSWVLRNAGVTVSAESASSYKSLANTQIINSNAGQVGDVLASDGHVMIIVGVNTEESYYIAAESNGLSAGYKPYTKGISYKKVSFNTSYSVVDMSSYYSDSSLHLTEEEYINAFNNGRLD